VPSLNRHCRYRQRDIKDIGGWRSATWLENHVNATKRTWTGSGSWIDTDRRWLRRQADRRRHQRSDVGLSWYSTDATEAHQNDVQVPRTAANEDLLRTEPQSRQQRSQTAVSQDWAQQTRSAGNRLFAIFDSINNVTLY